MTYLNNTTSTAGFEFNIEYSVFPDSDKVLYQIKTLKDPWSLFKPLYIGITSLTNLMDFKLNPTKNSFLKLHPINEEELTDNYKLFFINKEEKEVIYNLNDIDINKYTHSNYVEDKYNEIPNSVFEQFSLGHIDAYIYSPSNILYDYNKKLISFSPYIDFYSSLFPEDEQNVQNSSFYDNYETNKEKRTQTLISYIDYIENLSYLFSDKNITNLQKQKRILLGLEKSPNVRIHSRQNTYSLIPKINPQYISEAEEYYRNICLIIEKNTVYPKAKKIYANDINLITFCSAYLLVRQNLNTLLNIDVKKLLNTNKHVNVENSFDILATIIYKNDIEHSLKIKEPLISNSKKLKV